MRSSCACEGKYYTKGHISVCVYRFPVESSRYTPTISSRRNRINFISMRIKQKKCFITSKKMYAQLFRGSINKNSWKLFEEAFCMCVEFKKLAHVFVSPFHSTILEQERLFFCYFISTSAITKENYNFLCQIIRILLLINVNLSL